MSIPKMDWTQVVLNGEEPCFNFHPETDSQFCGRVKRWAGHRLDTVDAGGAPMGHRFVSLEAFITRLYEYYFAELARLKPNCEHGEEFDVLNCVWCHKEYHLREKACRAAYREWYKGERKYPFDTGFELGWNAANRAIRG